MKASDELFRLIRTLTSSEKRYFKTNAKRENPKSNYLQLFDAIDAQKEYDEDKLKKKHAGKKFVKYLSAEKNYLHEQIMKQMRAFHADRTIDNKINELLQDEAFYRANGLTELQEKVLKKAKELAQYYERFYLLKEILKLQTDRVIEFEKKRLTQPVLDLINEQKQLAILQETELELQTRNREVFSMLRAGMDMKSSSNRSRADLLITEVERFRTRLGDSFVLNTHFNRAYSNYYHLIGDRQKSFDHVLLEHKAFQQHPHFKKEDIQNYRICLANIMARSILPDSVEIFEGALNEMKSLPTTSFNEEGEVFQNVYFQEHLFYMNNGRFEEAESMIPSIEEGLERYKNKVNTARRLAFQFNIFVMFFVMHKFREALRWTNILLQDHSEIRQDQRFVVMLLLPIIHFELGHADLVETYTRSAYRFLQKKGRIHSFERLVIKYLSDMPLSTTQDAFKEKLDWFHRELKYLQSAKNEGSTLGMHELLLWSNYHLSGETMDKQLGSN